jgi:glycosyltransferase involved in cell wall biosynthesis
MRLGILASHPIQYQAPWFRALANEVDLEVFFAHRQSAAEQGKAGFGVAFEWDVDLLSGYQHHFLRNVAANPDVGTYAGCDTPEIAGIISGDAELGTRNAKPFDAFIVCGWYLKSYLQAVRACRAAGVPVLVRGDSQLRTPRSPLKRLAMEVRQRWLLRQFDGFLSVGQRHREYLEHFGVPAEKIFHVPHFVDNEWFAARAAEARGRRAEIRSQWGAAEGDLVALFVGKFIPKKRPMDLLKALSALNAQRSTFSFLAVLVGAGELEGELRDFAAREKLRVCFPGFKNQSELPACYVAADLLVLPSDGGETWGLVVNEAMACGLPAIVSDAVGCSPDLIEEEKTGFTYLLRGCAELAGRLESLAEIRKQCPDFAPALAAKMRAYSLEAAVEGTVAAIKQLNAKTRG